MISSQLYSITSTEEPKAPWDALQNHFDSLADKLFLRDKNVRIEMRNVMSI